MIVSFPFKADSRTVTFPFVASNMPKIVHPELSTDDMMLWARNDVPTSMRITSMLNAINMYIGADNLVRTSMQMSPGLSHGDMMIRASDKVPLWIAIDGSVVDMIGMRITTDELATDIFIDAMRTSLADAGFVIRTEDSAQTYKATDLTPDEICLRIRTDGSVAVGPINVSVDRISDAMQMADDADLHMEIGVLEDSDGRVMLVIQAADDVGTVRGTPTTIGYLDELKIGELDPDVIPDYQYIED